MMNKIIEIRNITEKHWVGDGFHVCSVFDYRDNPDLFSPFLLLDYGEPTNFTPTNELRGVGPHPHRGIETVTVAYSGEVAHKDSSGNVGLIQKGDVQWMTAGGGILHQEYHGEKFSREGGMMEMIQLWVDLPKKDKMTAAKYQPILSKDIPHVNLPENAGSVKVIAGELILPNHETTKGPASTFSPINLWDVELKSGKKFSASLPLGSNTLIMLNRGKIKFTDQSIHEKQLVVMERIGNNGSPSSIELTATEDAHFLLMNGAPLNQPVVGYGPFVMNTQEEIKQAYADFHAGKMGRM